MATPKLTPQQLQEAVDAVNRHGTITDAAIALGLPRKTFDSRVQEARRMGYSARTAPPPKESSVVDLPNALRTLLKKPMRFADIYLATSADDGAILDAIDHLRNEGVNIAREGDRWSIVRMAEAGWTGGAHQFELVSRSDNTFLFGASGDQHIGSKYFRDDVLRDLYARYVENDVQAVFNTGNYIDGEASFNRYDILAHGIDVQAKLMAEVWPKVDFPTFAVWGDDHEGWYAQRDGIDVGRYIEGIMRTEDHDWSDLGFMEAHVRLVNANTGKSVIMAVVHPGGGSSYAVSYRPQKIIESFEGGEKPAVALFGHYHKLDPGLVRNVWYLQTGTCQDQTPFMRKKSIEAHVGGAMVKLEQDPDTGAIIGFTPSLWRYFNKAYHVQAGAAQNRWSKHGVVTPIPRGIQA